MRSSAEPQNNFLNNWRDSCAVLASILSRNGPLNWFASSGSSLLSLLWCVGGKVWYKSVNSKARTRSPWPAHLRVASVPRAPFGRTASHGPYGTCGADAVRSGRFYSKAAPLRVCRVPSSRFPLEEPTRWDGLYLKPVTSE